MRKDFLLAKRLLAGSGITLLDAARLIRGIMDFSPTGDDTPSLPIQYCRKVIECGLSHYEEIEAISVHDAFAIYLESKSSLRPDSKTSLKYLSKRLLNSSPDFPKRILSTISQSDCETWLRLCFSTPTQFNKGRTMLYGFFQFAVKKSWCNKNPVKNIEKKKIIENEITPLPLNEIKRILKTASKPENKECAAAIGLMLFAGIRPAEVRRLRWADIDMEEEYITVRSSCSKTGGTRHVEICTSLKSWLKNLKLNPNEMVCPKDWLGRWRRIRAEAGFADKWVHDVLRHTYASYHAKRYRDLPRLQLNMGHRDLSLLRCRYINMANIKSSDAERFFEGLSFGNSYANKKDCSK